MTIRKGGKGRDHELFRSLYGKYYRRIVKFCITVFHLDEDDAKDLAQDVFIRFYEAMDEYRGDAEWAFLETIARRLAYNRIRAARTAMRGAPTVPIDEPLEREELVTQPPDFAQQQLDARRLQQLREAIPTLPLGQRQCVELLLKDMKYTEIAKTLRISVDAVRSRLRDARRELRDRLGVTLPEVEE